MGFLLCRVFFGLHLRGVVFSWLPARVLLGFSGPAVRAYAAGAAAATSAVIASMEVDEDTDHRKTLKRAAWKSCGNLRNFFFFFAVLLFDPEYNRKLGRKYGFVIFVSLGYVRIAGARAWA